MYKVQPKGINIKDNERDVPDGFLKESINLQWSDGAYRPIPERLESDIPYTFGLMNRIIIHKVSDEDRINVLAFSFTGDLNLIGYIVNGSFTESIVAISDFPSVPSSEQDSLSFTILNGLIYFMSSSQEFYYRLQYNETTEAYEVKDMYAWKDLILNYPVSISNNGVINKGGNSNIYMTQCGIILIRFTLVLKTGEEVLHSPIYSYYMKSINTGSSISDGDTLENIHTLINTNIEFSDISIFDEEISAINIYASTPVYQTEIKNSSTLTNVMKQFESDDAIGEIQNLGEKPFYLIKTLERPGDSESEDNILLYAGAIDASLDYPDNTYYKINTDTIAAGSVMPVDNFSYHKIYGKITSNNGRLIIESPKTVLSNGHIRAISIEEGLSRVAYYIDTEDGDLKGTSFEIDREIEVLLDNTILARGVLSYPDSRATFVGANEATGSNILLYKVRANKSHNISCCFDIKAITGGGAGSVGEDGDNFTFTLNPVMYINYNTPDTVIPSSPIIDPLSYKSDNRFQFSESGEFSVWPAINSYRVGEGKIVFTGSNSVDPANTDYIAPLLIGTTDGVYTANFDPTGVNLIQSITKTANLPALSDKNVLIDQNLVYVSDKGLIIINNGNVLNITENYFPDQGNGDFPINNDVYPNYDLLTDGISGDDFPTIDIVDYMKGALFAYDGRRNNLWCSNPDRNYSLIYNLKTKQWTMSDNVFTSVIDFNAISNTSEGEIFSRFLVLHRTKSGDSSNPIKILSGENMSKMVYTHLLTRGIKIQNPDQYKKIQRLISRCELYRSESFGYFTFGLWGKQDLNKNKVNFPLIAINDNSSTSFPNNIRQDIPVGRMKGKYKIITILQGGLILPTSSFDNFEITAIPVENNILR